jgi:transposase InsO family protein
MEFVRLAKDESCNFSLLCRRFGVSRKTGYKWLKRSMDQDDGRGLEDRSRRPNNSPGRTDAEIEQKVLKVRREHPAWGGRKIRKRLQVLGVNAPSASTITRILQRHQQIDEEESAKHRPFVRFEREAPNDLWQVDFKGEFALTNQRWCYPLTLLDDHSRFSLGVIACANQQRETVKVEFRAVFEKYGIPRAIYCDNGNPWGTTMAGCQHTGLTIWLMRHDIGVIHGRPYHPQGRGKLERFHRTLKSELLADRQFTSFEQVQSEFDPWREMYNTERPHEALDLDVPINHYQVSDRSFVEFPGEYCYDDRFTLRKVNSDGLIRFHGRRYRFSKAFQGEPVGLATTGDDGVWALHYCRFHVATLNERTAKITRCLPAS